MRAPAIYARQSLDRTGEALAVTRQLEDCRALIAAKGWPIAQEYVDNDVSASSTKVRPAFARLLDDVRGGKVDVIVSWAADRLTRRPIEVEQLIDLLEEHRVGLATVSGEVDLSTPYGRALARIFGAIARQEVEQKGARQARANRQRAKDRGDVRWTRRPFGYERADGHVVVVEDEARELKAAAAKVLGGSTMASVVRDLNERGVATSTGGVWSVTALRRLLLNPRHAGRAVYRGEDLGAGAWPAIFDPATQSRLEEVLRDPRRRTASTNSAKYLLSGLALCGRCGERVYASPMGPKGSYWMAYRCLSSHLARRLDLVDQVVERVILARLAQPDALSLLTPDEDVDALRAEAQELRERRDGLAALLADGLLSAASVREQAARLAESLAGIEQRMAAALGDSPAAGLAGAPDVDVAWAALSLAARRSVIDLLASVTILPAGKGFNFDPDTIRLDWRA